jgi:hypothetical protein
MSFWKSLFGGSASRDASASGAAGAKTTRSIEHAGFLIAAAPFPAEGQYQVAGVISKEVGGVRKEHRFVRADRCGSPEDATEIALRKGRQIVDEQGERLFS